jgi:hypothetical protein
MFSNVNTYFDQREFKKDPVKKTVNYNQYTLKANSTVIKATQIQKSEIVLSDSWVDFYPSQEREAFEFIDYKSEEIAYDN